jgi:hypothetical protein
VAAEVTDLGVVKNGVSGVADLDVAENWGNAVAEESEVVAVGSKVLVILPGEKVYINITPQPTVKLQKESLTIRTHLRTTL